MENFYWHYHRKYLKKGLKGISARDLRTWGRNTPKKFDMQKKRSKFRREGERKPKWKSFGFSPPLN